ncbi:hypothetical protein [Psychrobacter urativorans]|uniref:Lipoprotein n=1 Tax=Psychrobacter urativorans TaxID=45610 RepID=A0A0M4TG15_9GAMM|nr:hypothetical protein [Psychrobacter urativorans]ALF60341.1 hypothetical protein AOC03_10060 [Psychrobacter urativorans]
MKKLALYLLVGAALVGCGGDDSSSNSNSSPDPNPDPNLSVKLMPGFYEGRTNEKEFLEGLVDDNSRLWFTYAEDKPDNVIGFLSSNGPIILNNNKFQVSAKGYPYDNNRASRDNTITGDYKLGVINGTFYELPSKPITYNLKLKTASFKKHTLDKIDNKTITAPLYVTSGTGAAEATIKFTTNGNFTGKDIKGCDISGKFTQVASQRYFESSITFGQINCSAAGETLTGVASLDDVDTNLLILGTNGSSGRGMYFGS